MFASQSLLISMYILALLFNSIGSALIQTNRQLSEKPPLSSSEKLENTNVLKFTAGGQALAFGTSQVYLAGLNHALKVEFNGGNLVAPVADQNPGIESGSLPPLERVIYPEVWPGVTVEYTSSGNGMKSTFLVSAGANPADISLKYSSPLEIQPDGSLSITMENGRMTESAPVAWQEIDGRRVPVKVEFTLQGEGEVGFILGAYDPGLPLVIDPEYLWHGFWGPESAAADIVLDASGNIFLVGKAYSSWSGSDLRHAFNGTNNVVVVKLNSEGVYQWHAFYGGGDYIDPRSITLDSDGNMYIGGMTDNGDWGISPVINAYSAGYDAFILKLNREGAVVWLTFLGGSSSDFVSKITWVGGKIYGTGASSLSWGSPLHAHSGLISSYTYNYDLLVFKMDAASGSLQWHTFYGAQETAWKLSSTERGFGMALDSSGNIYVTGDSHASWGSPIHDYGYPGDITVLKLNNDGEYQWHTFLGSLATQEAVGNDIALDGSGNLYVVGSGKDINGCGTPIHSASSTTVVDNNIIVLKLDANGACQWHTLYGDNADTWGLKLIRSQNGSLLVGGLTLGSWSGEGGAAPLHAFTSGGRNLVLIKLNSDGAYRWHTFYGSNEMTRMGMAANTSGNIYLTNTSYAAWTVTNPVLKNPYTATAREISLLKLYDDDIPPTVTINRASGQADPTNGTSIVFDVVFNEAVTGFEASDVDLSASSEWWLLSASVTANSATSYTVTVSGMSSNSSGQVTASIPAGAAKDGSNNLSETSTSTDNSVTYDTVAPTVTINKATAQADPTNGTSIVFDVVFNEAVTGFSASDISFTGSTAAGTLAAAISGTGPAYTATVTGMTGSGTVVVSIPAATVKDTAGNNNSASTSTDNSVVYDVMAPDVTINQAAAQADPTNTASIVFDIVFNEAVTGFSASDISFTGSTAAGTLAAAISGTGPAYTATVTGMTGSGTVVASIPAGAGKDLAGNDNTASTSTDNTVLYDITAPDVTINQAAAQADPTNTASIVFDIVFNEAVTGFSASDISFTGSTAAGTLAAVVSGTGPAYTATVTGMTGSGTVVASIPAGAAQDAAGNISLTSTSSDNSVTYSDITGPTVSVEQAAGQVDPTNTGTLKFDVLFNESVTDFTAGDVAFTGSTAPGTLVAAVTGSGSVYVVTVTGMTGTGLVVVSIPAGSAHDSSGNSNSASTSSDNKIQYNDITGPTASVEQAAGQTDPTNTAEIVFDVVFSEAVSGLEPVDLSFAGSTAPGTLNAVVNGSGAIYTVTVTGMTGNGLVMISVSASAAQDSSGNGSMASTSTDNSVTYIDNTAPEVTIEQAGGQADPTRDSQIFFDVLFSEEVVDFTASDVILSASTAPGTLSAVVSGSGAVYTVTVTGMTANGSVVVSIPVGAAQDSSGNGNLASTSVDNSVDYDIVSIEIMDGGVTVLPLNMALVDNATYGSAFSTLNVEFKEDVNDPAGDDDSQDVTNPENYLLVRAGINKKIDTESCLGGVKPDDIRVAVSKAVYDNQLGAGPFTVTLTLNQGVPLPPGNYRLLLCGTTSITDLAGNKLHGGQDVAFNFTIEDSGGEGDPNRLPLTGFAVGQVTGLPEQPAGKIYTDTGLRLVIPTLGINLPITGVPLSNGEWDITWLGQQAGYLEGSAFPTTQGNSVLTGHVWDANNQPGPFVGLRELTYGTPVLIHAWGKTYTYQVLENIQLDPGSVQAVLHPKEKGAFVTLVTCEGFRPASSGYRYRRMVRAVLVSVSEK